jgi:hypothetical protein
MKTWQIAALGITSLLGTACSDLEPVPTQAPHQLPPIAAPHEDPDRVIAMTDGGSSDVPEEFIGHYTWLDVSADVGWMSPNQAYGQAILRYWASNATASVELKVTNASGSVVGSNTASSQDWHLIPWKGTLYASTTVMVSATCGLIAQASAKGTVWDSAISSSQGLLSWGNKVDSEGKSAPQPACVPPPTSPTSPSGGDGSTPPSTGTTQPPTYEPAPFVPSGHWECVIWYMGTDYQREYCTWYPDYAKLPVGTMSLTRLSAPGSVRHASSAADVPSIFVIVSDKVPANAMAIVERHRQGPFKNVLLVPSPNVRPAVLVAALRALSDSRAKHGETPAIDLELRLEGSILDQQIPVAARDYAANFVALIGKAGQRDAGAYGVRQVLELRLGDRK